MPDNTVLTQGSVNNTTQTFLSQSVAITDGGTNALFTINGATTTFGIQAGKVVRTLPNLFASVAVFKFERGAA